MWTQKNIIMISTLSGWRIGRILMRKKIRLLKQGLVPLFLMDWQTSMLDVMLEFLNTFLIKGVDIYFGIMIKCMYLANK